MNDNLTLNNLTAHSYTKAGTINVDHLMVSRSLSTKENLIIGPATTITIGNHIFTAKHLGELLHCLSLSYSELNI